MIRTLRNILRAAIATICALTFALPCATPQTSPQPTQPFKFEVTSIHPSKPDTNWSQGRGYLPDGYEAIGNNMWMTIMLAYNSALISESINVKLLNAPPWVTQVKYDIQARVANQDLAAWQAQKNYMLERAALQDLLKERCKLSMHSIPSQQDVYFLVLDKHGPKIQEHVPGDGDSLKGMQLGDGGKMLRVMHDGRRDWHVYGATMHEFAIFLSNMIATNQVIDHTGLKGRYDFIWPEKEAEGQENASQSFLDKWPISSLGLTLRSGKAPGVNWVIDHIEQPSQN